MKANILIPIAGAGSRFPINQWIVPKPLILIDNKRIIEWAMKSVDTTDCQIIFVVRRSHINDFSIDSFLKSKFGEDIKICVAEENTEGAVCSSLLAREYIDNDTPLIVHCSDVFFEPVFNCSNFDNSLDGCILTFKSNSLNYSYSKISSENLVLEVAEKKPISDQASAGVYWFKKGSDFVLCAENMVSNKSKTNNEYYIAPLFNEMIKLGKKIGVLPVEKINIFGTPEEYDFFTKNPLPLINKQRVAICCDHSGINSKLILKEYLKEKGIDFIDFGCFNESDTDYGPYVKDACKSIIEGKCSFGIGFCRSGQGVNITANKIRGIRASWVCNSWLSEMAIRHNCANFLSISEKMNNKESIIEIFDSYWENTFDGGRHQNRLMKIEQAL